LALSGCEPGPADRDAAPGPTISRAEAAALFAEHCVICHGERGDGQGARRGSLYNKPPDFRSHRWRCATSASEVGDAIREGVPVSDMPPWRRLGDDAIRGLADYVLALGGPC
jgi:mono/diheme cytochrome c family protein